MLEKQFTLTKDQFLKLYNASSDLYDLCVVLNTFCGFHKDNEIMQYAYSLSKYTRRLSDDIVCYFAQIDMDSSNRKEPLEEYE